MAPMQLQGPLARRAEPLVGSPSTASATTGGTPIAGVRCVVSRTGWSGGPGYEIYPLGSSGAPGVWEALVEAGGGPSGLVITGPNVPHAIECGITDLASTTPTSA